jgi:glycosyltransferase involved in cell wall biosynthesis
MILVCHPGGNASIYDVFRSLQAARDDAVFCTGFHFPPLAESFAAYCDRIIGTDLSAHVQRRRVMGASRSQVLAALGAEIIPALGVRSRSSASFLRSRNDYFVAFAIKKIHQARPNVVITHTGLSTEIIQAAHCVGATVLLHEVIAHQSAYRDILLDARKKTDWRFAGDSERFLTSERYVPNRDHDLVDHLLVGSDRVAQSFERLGVVPERIHRIFYPVDLESFHPVIERKPNSKKKIFFCGTIGFRKGITVLLEAVDILNRKDVEFIACGYFHVPPELRADVEKRITVVPPMARRRLVGMYNSADIFLLPTLHEGSSVVVYEAMACGLPVITTEQAGSVIRDGQDGFIVPALDAEETAARVAQLLDNDHLRRDMGQSARRRVQSFSQAALTKRLSTIIEKIETPPH